MLITVFSARICDLCVFLQCEVAVNCNSRIPFLVSCIRSRVWYEPTDVNKASKPWKCTMKVGTPNFASPNVLEFCSLISHLSKDELREELKDREQTVISFSRVLKNYQKYLHAFDGVMVTMGESGFVIVRWCEKGEEDSPLLSKDKLKSRTEEDSLAALHFESEEINEIVSVSGAGDCLAAGFIAGMLQGRTVSECAYMGKICASLSLQASEAVPKSLNAVNNNNLTGLPYTLLEV